MRIRLAIALCTAAAVSAHAEEPAKPAAPPPPPSAGVTVDMGALPTHVPMPRRKPAPEELRALTVPMPRPKPDPAALASLIPMPRWKPTMEVAAAPSAPAQTPPAEATATPAEPTPLASPQSAAILRGTTPPPAEPVAKPVDPTLGFSVFTRVRFQVGKTALGSDAKTSLDTLAQRLLANEERVRLAAFSGKPGDSSSDARRLSLERALAVRTYLESKGIAPSRVDLLVFGGSTNGASDRVDVLVRPA
jgi:outer membrane protein OmpA-like peptidoglycan-associated protein